MLKFSALDGSDEMLISVQQNLLNSVSAALITGADASVIAGELAKADGVLYTIPDATKLKNDLGFPNQQEIAIGDWGALLQADVQRVLEVDLRTASYLASRFEIEYIDQAPAAADNVVTNAAALPAPGEITPTRN